MNAMRKLYLVKDKSFYKKMLVMMLPVVMQQAINMGVNMLDTMMLGSLGEIQLSGSSLANEFISLYQILCLGIGGGAAVLTSQYWGAGDVQAVRRVVTLMLRVSLSVALLFGAVTLFAPEAVMSIYASEPEVIEAGALYFRISSPTFLLTGIIVPVTVVLRSVRQVKLPLVASIIYFFSGSAPGPYCIILITFLAVLASIFRQAYLRKGFSALMLCSAMCIFLYEACVFLIGLFLKQTYSQRFGLFMLTAALTLICLPAGYPIALSIGKIGGEVWKE